MQHAGEGAQQSCLAEAWYSFEQHVAATQKADQHTLHYFILTDNNFADFVCYGFEALCRRREIAHYVILCKKERQCLSFQHGMNPIRNFNGLLRQIAVV